MMISQMTVHLVHKPVAQRIFITLLTDSVQQLLKKFQRMMDQQFLRYQTVLGTSCDEGNWILSGQFAEAVFSGTWRAWMIGTDSFSETGQTRCALYLWAALQTHRVLQEYVELDFIAHPEVSAMVVEHLIQTRVPMAMHEAFKQDVKDVKFQNKSLTEALEKLGYRMGKQGSDIQKLQQYMKVALKK
jgi:hypothetical protein